MGRRSAAVALCVGLVEALTPSVLVVGCSGGTGRRAVAGLVDGGVAPESMSFLTRNASRSTAAGLVAMGLTPVVCDLDDAGSLDWALGRLGPLDGVYVHGTAGDEKKIDVGEADRAARLGAALGKLGGAPTVVYNSAAAPDGTGIPRIEQKRAAEAALLAAAGGNGVALRAHLFMEELWKGYTRPAIIGPKRRYAFSVPTHKPLCLTSVKDMGKIAARCILEDDNPTGALDVVSDVLSPHEMAAAFSDSMGGKKVIHKQSWTLYLASKFLLPELHQIISFYRKTDFSPYAAQRPALLAHFDAPPALQTFSAFLEDTKWADFDRDYASLAASDES